MAMPQSSSSNSNQQLRVNNIRNNPPHNLPNSGSTGLDRSVTEIRKTLLTPQGERIESITEYMPGRCLSPMPGYKVTELVKTREILKAKFASSSISTRERLFNFNINDAVCIRGPTVQTRALPVRYRVNNPRTLVRHFPYPFHSLNRNGNSNMVHSSSQDVLRCAIGQNPIPQNPTRTIAMPHGEGSSNTIPNPLPNAPFVANDDKQSQDLRPGINSNIDEPNTNGNGASETANMVISDDHGNEQGGNNDDGEVGDGKIRSLPHRKYGPYTCPRCMANFPTSQHFAAHVTKHYRNDGRARRRRRLTAKIQRTKFRIAHCRYGLTVVPVLEGDIRGQQPDQFAPPGFTASQQQNQAAPPPGFTARQRQYLDAPPGFTARQQLNRGALPGFPARQQHNQVAPPPGFTARQQLSLDAPPDFAARQHQNLDAPPGFTGARVKVEPAQF